MDSGNEVFVFAKGKQIASAYSVATDRWKKQMRI